MACKAEMRRACPATLCREMLYKPAIYRPFQGSRLITDASRRVGVRRSAPADRQNVLFAADKSRCRVDFWGDSMPSLHVDRTATRFQRPDSTTTAPSTAWTAPPSVSDDECLALLAKAVASRDPESLDEVAWLIGRLAVPIE
jgi:hypothetical protein